MDRRSIVDGLDFLTRQASRLGEMHFSAVSKKIQWLKRQKGRVNRLLVDIDHPPWFNPSALNLPRPGIPHEECSAHPQMGHPKRDRAGAGCRCDLGTLCLRGSALPAGSFSSWDSDFKHGELHGRRGGSARRRTGGGGRRHLPAGGIRVQFKPGQFSQRIGCGRAAGRRRPAPEHPGCRPAPRGKPDPRVGAGFMHCAGRKSFGASGRVLRIRRCLIR